MKHQQSVSQFALLGVVVLVSTFILSGCSLSSQTEINNNINDGASTTEGDSDMNENGDHMNESDMMMEDHSDEAMMHDDMGNDETGIVRVNADGSVNVEVGASATTPDQTIVLTGKNFEFNMNGEKNPDIRVKEGDLVRIEFTSESGFHDWVVDEFSAATGKVQTGGSTVVEFVASKKGTFEYYCSVGSHRQMGMKGNLIVE